MRTVIRCTAIAAILCLTHAAWAGEKYVLLSAGAASGGSDAKDSNDAALVRAGLTGVQSTMAGNSTGYKIFLGYQFNPNFAMEGGYVDLGTRNYSAAYTGGSLSVDVATYGYNISALGMIPLNPSLSLFGKTGLTLASVRSSATTSTGTTISTSEDKSSLGYGVGVQYQLNSTIGLRTEWERVATDANLVSLSLQFKY